MKEIVIKKCRAAWEWMARLPIQSRVFVKALLFGVILCGVLNPHPILFLKQLSRYANLEQLIQPDFAGIDAINREIDALAPPGDDSREELAIVERFVYRHIAYQYDWDNWGNIDFWPTAQEVWERQREDCDGQAVLAVSILRSRGFESAVLVGNMRHIWVRMDHAELMGPDEALLDRQADGQVKLALPSLNLLLGSLAFYLSEFPVMRNLVLYIALLTLCYHPATSIARFWGLCALGLAGALLLTDWAHDMARVEQVTLSANFVIGGGMFCLAFLAALRPNMSRCARPIPGGVSLRAEKLPHLRS